METNEIKRYMTSEEIAAWFEWRRWCSVWRVKMPHGAGTEEYAQFKDDKTPEERQEYYRYRLKKIGRAMINRINKWHECQGVNKRIKFDFEADFKIAEAVYAEYISVFDSTMKTDKKKTSEEFPSGSYKDYVFHLIAKKPEDTAKIINGKIFGPQHGYINELLLNAYLRENENLARGPRGGILYENVTDSLSTPLAGDDKRTFEDAVAKESTDYYNDLSTIEQMAYKTLSKITREEKIILVASGYGVRISNPELLSFLHCAKEKAGNMKTELLKKLIEAFSCEKDLKNVLLFMKDICFDELLAEKELRTFLYTIKAKADAKEKAIAETETEGDEI